MLILLCGPPASGKTTLARRLRDRLADRGYEFSLLHSDDFDRRTYERMEARVREAGGDWILDGTFFRQAHRERFSRLEDDRFVVWVRAPLETRLARNREREDAISERGVYVVSAEFEPPRADLTLDTDARSVDEVTERLVAAVLRWLETDAAGESAA